MLKKIVSFLLPMLFVYSFAFAGTPDPDRFGHTGGVFIGTLTQERTANITIEQGNLGIGGKLDVQSGILNVHETFIDIAAASQTAYCDVDISTATLIAATTTQTLANADYTDIITPRNVTAVVTFDTGVATTTVTGTLTVTGTTTRGTSTTESITVSTTSATGNIAWRTITSLAWSITAISGRADSTEASLQVGSGNKIGLSNDITAAGDVYKVIATGALESSSSYTLSTTYDTIDFSDDPDGSSDYEVYYKADTK